MSRCEILDLAWQVGDRVGFGPEWEIRRAGPLTPTR